MTQSTIRSLDTIKGLLHMYANRLHPIMIDEATSKEDGYDLSTAIACLGSAIDAIDKVEERYEKNQSC